ncbi:hypothetical protein [Piscinibacter sakaiensis]|uniref:hypothetical protein n=1 Tax=Piscinibacter sakaiensis TaxID=1547922 RepID=UPI003AAC162D
MINDARHLAPRGSVRAAAFVLAAFARPTTVGALLPSSRHLALAMAEAAAGAERLIELGAGTGAITEALCREHPGIPTTAVELEPRLAQHLSRRFPGIEVRAAAADEVLRAMSSGHGSTVLVSSLPFRSLPPFWRQRSRQAIEDFLLAQPMRRLIQFTYQPRVPFDLQHVHALRWRRVGVIWRNAPPAWVWELGPVGNGLVLPELARAA